MLAPDQTGDLPTLDLAAELADLFLKLPDLVIPEPAAQAIHVGQKSKGRRGGSARTPVGGGLHSRRIGFHATSSRRAGHCRPGFHLAARATRTEPGVGTSRLEHRRLAVRMPASRSSRR